jgi:hypothetical protein
MLIHTALDVGQLVKDEYFTLFESIGAIEVCQCSISVTDTMLIHFRSWTPRWTAASCNLERRSRKTMMR